MDFRRALICCVFVIACALANEADKKKEKSVSGKIVGGQSADITEVPHQVSLLRNLGGHFCGGSIIHPQWVLTAAHCVQNTRASSMSVRVGSNYPNRGGEIIPVVQIIKHPSYSPVTVNNDIALLLLRRPATAGKEVEETTRSKDGGPKNPKKKRSLFDNDIALLKLICPVDLNNSTKMIRLARTEPATGSSTWVTGYGVTREGSKAPSSTLRAVSIPIVDRATCSRIYRGVNTITPAMMCAGYMNGGKDACQGDSGGPLTRNMEQVGVVSWGAGCGQMGKPGVYTSVAYMYNWIRQYVPLGY